MTYDDLIKSANEGIIGINDNLCVYSGYDQSVTNADAIRAEWLDDDDYPEMTKEDKIKLADRMIGLWSKYRDAINAI